jgi:hypothetical protein
MDRVRGRIRIRVKVVVGDRVRERRIRRRVIAYKRRDNV